MESRWELVSTMHAANWNAKQDITYILYQQEHNGIELGDSENITIFREYYHDSENYHDI